MEKTLLSPVDAIDTDMFMLAEAIALTLPRALEAVHAARRLLLAGQSVDNAELRRAYTIIEAAVARDTGDRLLI